MPCISCVCWGVYIVVCLCNHARNKESNMGESYGVHWRGWGSKQEKTELLKFTKGYFYYMFAVVLNKLYMYCRQWIKVILHSSLSIITKTLVAWDVGTFFWLWLAGYYDLHWHFLLRLLYAQCLIPDTDSDAAFCLYSHYVCIHTCFLKAYGLTEQHLQLAA